MFPQSEPARVSLSAPLPPGAVRSALGFTMIELLVVISIVGVLAALIIPAVSGVKASGQSIKCVSNLRQIYVASQAWSSENDGKIVPVFNPGEDPPAKLGNWTGLLAPYLGRSSTNVFASAKDLPVAVCPVNPNQFGYGYNSSYLSMIQLSLGIERWATMAQVASRPGGLSRTVFLCDRERQPTNTTFTSGRPFVRNPGSGMKDYVPSFRHPGKTANVLWLDGHISGEKADGAWMNPNDSFWGKP